MNDIKMIPFSQLTLSPNNARKTAANPAKDKELRASIESQGILQNLVVKPNGGPDQFEVTAGGRRFTTLQALVADKVEGFDSDYPVPCLIQERADLADEASLTENICREEMDLVDQYEAYEKLHSMHGMSVKDLARHFGKSQNEVRKALKLGGIHPELLDLYRARKLDIDDLMAFALEDNPEKQLEIYQSVTSTGPRIDEHRIREMITKSDITNKDPRVKFVGLQEYKKAGGTTANDIFHNIIYVLDETWLDRLVKEKLDQVVEELKVEWSWVEVDLDFQPWKIWRHTVLEGEPNPPDELKQQLEDLKAKEQEIDKAYVEGREDDLSDELKGIADTIEEDVLELEQKVDLYIEHTEEQKAKSGCIVTIDKKGELAVYKGVVDEAREEGEETTGEDGAPAKKKAKKKPEEKKLSQVLQDDLARYKHMVAKWSLVRGKKAEEPYALGCDLALFTVCYQVLLPEHSYWSSPLDITARETSEETSIKDRESYEVYTKLKYLRADLDLSWMDQDPMVAFKNFRALDNADKQFLMAYVAAVTLKRDCYGEQGTFLDMVLDEQIHRLADHWRPTKDNFFKRATKPFLLEAGNHMFDDEWSKRCGKEKKGILAEQLHDKVHELDSEQVWLPEGMEPLLD